MDLQSIKTALEALQAQVNLISQSVESAMLGSAQQINAATGGEDSKTKRIIDFENFAALTENDVVDIGSGENMENTTRALWDSSIDNVLIQATPGSWTVVGKRFLVRDSPETPNYATTINEDDDLHSYFRFVKSGVYGTRGLTIEFDYSQVDVIRNLFFSLKVVQLSADNSSRAGYGYLIGNESGLFNSWVVQLTEDSMDSIGVSESDVTTLADCYDPLTSPFDSYSKYAIKVLPDPSDPSGLTFWCFKDGALIRRTDVVLETGDMNHDDVQVIVTFGCKTTAAPGTSDVNFVQQSDVLGRLVVTEGIV